MPVGKAGWSGRGSCGSPQCRAELCRYDSDSGFYEPISKPSIMANGTLGSGNSATIEMTYIQGRMRGEIPTMLISYNNKFKLVTTYSSPALFTYISGEWVLLTVGNP